MKILSLVLVLNRVELRPNTQTFSFFPLTGQLLSTTSGAHGEGASVESRDGGEELSTPVVKHRCMHDEDSSSLVPDLEREPVHGESVTLPRHVPYEPHFQHYSSSRPSLKALHHVNFHPSHCPFPQAWHQPLHQQQPSMYQPLQNPFIQPLPVQSSYQHAELTLPFYKHYPLNPSPSEHAHPPTEILIQQQTYQFPFQMSTNQPYVYPLINQSPHVLLNTLLEVYANFLRSCYAEHEFTSTKWPHLDAKKYINLAVISNEYANCEELAEFRQQTIHGSIDDILEWKSPIEMKNILKPNCVHDNHDDEKHKHYPVNRILIEGAPGIGKSTFAWEVCQKWGQHQLFKKYALVVMLKFRDKRVQDAKSVADMFYHPNPKLQYDIFNVITTTGGHGLLLILEGFDEAPASKRTMDSIFVSLFRGQELPKATVILTTRPSASTGLRKLCKGKHSRRIEILGFGKKEIDEYIQCAFSDEQSQLNFNEYLSFYPHIQSMMYVPLNSVIVTHVYESCRSSGIIVPKTVTQLYSSLIRTLLLRYLQDKEEYKDTCTTINTFKDLPQPVYDQFCEICKIAYTGIMSAETELIFQDLPSSFDSLGLMQTCPELYVDRGASLSYNFLHLTLQEYLAAYHISQQSRDKQVAFMREQIKRKNSMEARLGRDVMSKKLEVVVRFLAGLTELGSDLWDVVREFASNKSKEVELEILHWLFESQDPSAVTSVLGSEYVYFYDTCARIRPFDWYVLGCCITNSSCDWKLRVEQFNLESAEIFVKALNLQQDYYQSQPTGMIKKMYLVEKPNQAAVHLLVDKMPQMLVFSNLTHLALTGSRMDGGNEVTPETCNLLSKQKQLLQHLEYLDLNRNKKVGSGGAVNLIISLTKYSNIRYLDLMGTKIGFEDCKALYEMLTSSRHIQVLDISYNYLSPETIQLIVDGLSQNTSLEILKIYNCSNFSSENILHLASVLRVNTSLKELDIGNCGIQGSDCVHIAKALEESTTTQLQALELTYNPIGSEGAAAFACMLKRNQCLKKLDLFLC